MLTTYFEKKRNNSIQTLLTYRKYNNTFTKILQKQLNN